MWKYFEKKRGIIWAIVTVIVFFYIFWFILKELLLTFALVVALGIIVWGITAIRKRMPPK